MSLPNSPKSPNKSSKSSFKRPRPDAARLIAYDLVSQVNREGAYANIRLPELLAQSRCDDRDRAFTTELAYGTLRMQGKYDYAIASKVDRPFSELDASIVDVLRLGLHQILEMRVPDHAAVDATVELARAVCGEGKASYVNAILRSLLREPVDFAGCEPSIQYSHPSWIISALASRLPSEDRLIPLLTAHNTPTAPHLVAWPGKSTQSELCDEGAEFMVEGKYAARATQMPGKYAAVHERRAGVQDLGSQLISEIFFKTAGNSEYLAWLDMCAGPGGKAALLHNLLREHRPKDHFTANEPTEHRAELVTKVVPRNQVISFKGEDLPSLPNRYDRILIDAPCSGLGALRRRPESRWTKNLTDLKNLVTIQRDLLDAGVAILKPQGIIAYVTCSPHKSETVAQVADFLHRHKNFTLISAAPFIPDSARGMDFLEESGTIQMWSDAHGTDSMFMALFAKIDKNEEVS